MELRQQILAQQACDGNRDAFGALYALYYKELYSYALYVLGNVPLAQDAVQEAVLAAYRQLNKLRDPQAFRYWLFRILANECRRALREKINARKTEPLENLAETLQALPEELSLSCELRQALGVLDVTEREIILLHVLGGYKSHEIANALDCNSSTVRSKQKRAFEKLRTVLQTEEL